MQVIISQLCAQDYVLRAILNERPISIKLLESVSVWPNYRMLHDVEVATVRGIRFALGIPKAIELNRWGGQIHLHRNPR